ncbi:MAG: NAD(P)/FAD-dependent oxidoreductase [Myxococcota bacterium]
MSTASSPHRTDVIVLGAGLAGIGTAATLLRAGVTNFVVLDGGNDVGGTWRDNSYPGAACDVPSHLYSFSFAPKATWTRMYSPHDEILEYIRDVTDRFGVRPYLRLGQKVERARWDDDRGCWCLSSATGDHFEAKALVSCIGALRDPAIPSIPGLDGFAGPVMHSAAWDHDVDLCGLRVGVVGTGASAIQIVPALADQVERLEVFQRSAPWIVPRDDFAYPQRAKRAFRWVPGLRRAYRSALYANFELRYLALGPLHKQLRNTGRTKALTHLHGQIADPALRRKLTPDYEMGCKRVLVSDDYYPALTQPHVALHTQGIEAIEERAIRLTDGERIEIDTLILATGFTVRSPLGSLDVRGRGGTSLNARWQERPSAYLGAAVPDFPNLFIVTGPNTGLGHNSIIFMMESQLRMIGQAVCRTLEPRVRSVEVSETALRAFEAEVDQRTPTTVWGSGCQSWYLTEDGTNFAIWPGSSLEFWWRTRRFDERAFLIRHHRSTQREPIRPTSRLEARP